MSWPKRSLGVIGIAVIAILNGWHLVPVQTFAWATMAIGDASQGRTFTETLTAAIGLNFIATEGPFKDNRFAIEYSLPILEYLNGFQLST